MGMSGTMKVSRRQLGRGKHRAEATFLPLDRLSAIKVLKELSRLSGSSEALATPEVSIGNCDEVFDKD